MKRNLMPLLGVAFVAATVATGIFYGLLLPKLRGGVSANSPGTIVLAASSLDRGTVLKAEHLKTTALDKNSLPAGAMSSPDQAIGRTLLEPVQASQPLQIKQLADRGVVGGASLAIPSGSRAVTIHPVDSMGVVGMMKSGSRVDVQVLARLQTGDTAIHRMLEDVEVLHVQGANADSRARPVVTLLVSPREADRLSLADASMRVRIVLRNPTDRAANGPSSLSSNSLFTGQNQ